MSYLFSRKILKETIKQVGKENDIQVFQDLFKNSSSLKKDESNKNSIFPFSHSSLKDPSSMIALTNISKVHLSSILKEKYSKDKFDIILNQISPTKKRLIQFNPKLFSKFWKNDNSLCNILFSSLFLSHFRIGKTLFNFGFFSEVIKEICILGNHLADLIQYTSIPGYLLSIDDISDFISKHVKEIKHLEPLYLDNDENIPLYKQLVIEYVAFNLDPLGTNRISPIDLICDPDFNLFLELDQNNDSENPFTLNNFLKVFRMFSLSVSENGLLSQDGLARIQDDFSFSRTIIQRMFETMTLYDGQLDFSGFLHIYMCHKNVDKQVGANFFFDLLDIDGDGIIGLNDVSYFYKDLKANSDLDIPDSVPLDVFLQELLDKTGSKTQGFTLQQLLDSHSAEEIIAILTDYSEFEKYFDQNE